MSALPQFSDVDLLGNRKRVVHLDPEIADCALDLRVAQQNLNCSKVPGKLVEPAQE
jgi:hypothetical protein